MTWEAAVRSLIDDPAQAELVRDCYFDLPVERAAARFYAGAEWAAVRDILGTSRGKALDIGAGNGIVSYALASDGWQTTALEPDPSDLVGGGAIRRLSGYLNAEINVIDGFGEAIPAPDGSFDLVLARQVLHHARDLSAFCAEAARVLKRGGVFFAYRDHVVSGPEQLPAFFDQHPLHRLYGGENAFTEAAYSAAIAKAGLNIQKRWRQFEAAFNYAPKSRYEVALEAASRALPVPLARLLAAVAGSAELYPLLGMALSTIDRRPGRIIAYLAVKP